MAEEKKKIGRPKGAKDKQKRKSSPYKPGRKINGVAGQHDPELEEGYNTNQIYYMMEITPPESYDVKKLMGEGVDVLVNALELRLREYLEITAKYDKKVGNMSCYYALGIDKETADKWYRSQSTNPMLRSFIKKVKKICGMYRESLMSDGKVNPVVGIFWQKNYDGMKDQTEMIVANNNPLGDTVSASELEKKYLGSTYGVPEIEQKAPTPGEVLQDVEIKQIETENR